MEKTIRIKRDLAYTGTILKIYRDTVIANGIEEVYDYIHHDGAAAVLPVKGWKDPDGAPVPERFRQVYP